MNDKVKSIIALVAFGGIMSAYLIQCQSLNKERARVALLSKSTTAGQAQIVERYVHDSIEHVVVKEVPVTNDAEKSLAVGSGYLDTLTTALKVASNRIEEVTKVNARLTAENIALKQDSGSRLYRYNDRWLSLEYQPDSNRVNLNYDVSLNVAKYWKRKWLFAPKEYFIDISSDDARVNINSVKRFTLQEKKQKRLGIGFTVGYNYMPLLNKWQPALGFGLNYNLVEF